MNVNDIAARIGGERGPALNDLIVYAYEQNAAGRFSDEEVARLTALVEDRRDALDPTRPRSLGMLLPIAVSPNENGHRSGVTAALAGEREYSGGAPLSRKCVKSF